MEKQNIRFFQMLVTNWHRSSSDVSYKHVFNYATLAEAMRCPFYAGDLNKRVRNGESFIDPISRTEKYQYVMQYLDENGNATLELRHERFVEDDAGKGTEMYQVLIKEIKL